MCFYFCISVQTYEIENEGGTNDGAAFVCFLGRTSGVVGVVVQTPCVLGWCDGQKIFAPSSMICYPETFIYQGVSLKWTHQSKTGICRRSLRC
jgi:hypothetical protein